jgi:preprotein translocase subunit SecG
MYEFLVVLILILCGLLVLLVAIQNSKGGGVATNLRTGALASELMGGSVRAANLIEKITWWVAGLIAVFIFTANIVLVTGAKQQNAGQGLRLEKMNTAVPATPAPAAPTAPGTDNANPLQTNPASDSAK